MLRDVTQIIWLAYYIGTIGLCAIHDYVIVLADCDAKLVVLRMHIFLVKSVELYDLLGLL